METNYSDQNPAQETTESTTPTEATVATPVQPSPEASVTQTPEQAPAQPSPEASTDTKEVEFVATKENNKQVKTGNKSVAKENVVSVTKKTLKFKQTELTEKMLTKAQSMGVGLKITRGRLSNMCNGNCNVTAQAEQVCKALLEEAGWTAKEKAPQEAPTVNPTAVA